MRRPGPVVWLTGLPSSGKSTLALALQEELRRLGTSVCVLDGDDVRKALATPLGYSADERAAFYDTLARLAALLANQGLVVVVAATAHRRAFRERARELSPAFVEVWVDTPLEECRRRDSKGLYRAQAAGSARQVPGVGTDYETPLAPDVVAHGGADSAAIAAILERLRST